MYEITSYLQHLQPHPHLERSEGTSGQCRNRVPNSRESKSSKVASCNTSPLRSFSPQQNIQYQSPKKNPNELSSSHPDLASHLPSWWIFDDKSFTFVIVVPQNWGGNVVIFHFDYLKPASPRISLVVEMQVSIFFAIVDIYDLSFKVIIWNLA